MASRTLSDGVLELLLLLILSLLIGHLLKTKQVRFFQASGAATLIGALFGCLVRIVGPALGYQPITKLNTDILFVFLLPAIIFESGYTMDKVVSI